MKTSVRDTPRKRTITFDPPITLGKHGGKVVVVSMHDGTVVALVARYWRKD